VTPLARATSFVKRRVLLQYLDELYVYAPSNLASSPTIFVANHISYWDGFVASEVAAMLGKKLRLQVSEVVLRDFPFLRPLGISSVNETDSMSVARALAADCAFMEGASEHALWIFAQGRYRPHESASEHFRKGVAHLVKRLSHAAVVPVALRYDVLRTRKPVAYVDVGHDISGDLAPLSRSACVAALQADHRRLVAAQTDKLRTGEGRYTPLLANRKGSYAAGRFFYTADVRRQLRGMRGVADADVRANRNGFVVTVTPTDVAADAVADFLIDRYSLEEMARSTVEAAFQVRRNHP
jgi:hypothetical protein